MPELNIIDCKYKAKIKIFVFALSMYNKSLLSGNIDVFEDFNIVQIKIDKTNAWWNN